MLNLFGNIRNFFKISRETSDCKVFYLHYRFTTALLLLICIVLITVQISGKNITCDNAQNVNKDVLDTFCWIQGTFSVFYDEKAKNQPIQGIDIPYLGVDRGNRYSLYSIFNRHEKSRKSNYEIRKHKYYQWVVLTLLCQAILFYTPRWLWKSWEGGKIRALMMDLDIGVCSEVEKKQKKKLLLDYLWENLRFHNWWAYKYYFCEFLSLVNVVGQMFLMDKFFDGAFFTFGIKVIQFMESDQEFRNDPMIRIFPRMTKCTFVKFGVSGDLENHDAICILPLNVVNEKIYIFLWFWFIILTVLTTLTIMYRIVIIFSPRMRVYLLRMRFRLVKKAAIETIVRNSKMGDWFLFYMLGENIDSLIFRDVLHELALKLGTNHLHHIPGIRGEVQDA